ncbi:STAS domain-containing protein [Actinoplanes sp. NPDC023936]|uniref:STAS domain-containing protein n=1 Tax=Actinoplanes sp. NPDC023936 TaxID=3154910 RepID=UPI00340C24C4
MTTSILDIAVDVDFPPACYLSLRGELDLSGTAELAAAIDEALTAGAEHVLIDLYQLTFIDMTGGGTLVRCRAASTAAGSGFLVTGARGFVRRVLDISGIWPLISRPNLPAPAAVAARTPVLPVPVPASTWSRTPAPVFPRPGQPAPAFPRPGQPAPVLPRPGQPAAASSRP